MIHFNIELWNNHQLCVLQDLNEKKKKQFQQEKQKNWLRHKCHDIISECRDIISECRDIISREPVDTMSQQR